MASTMDSLSLIHQFLHDQLGVEPERIIPEARLAPLGVDSLMILELMFEFEERFGITLAKGLQAPRTVGEMASLMDRLRSEQQA